MKRIRFTALAGCLALVGAVATGQVIQDSVLLEDGRELVGSVIEWKRGDYLAIAEAAGPLRVIPDADVIAVSRTLGGRIPSDVHTVVFLDSGLVVRGQVVQYTPAGDMVLATSAGPQLVLPADMIMKSVLIYEPLSRPAGDAPPSDALVRTEALTVSLDIAMGRLRRNSRREQQADTLGEEIRELDERLEREEKGAARDADEDNAEAVGESVGSAEEALAELAERARQCETSQETREKGDVPPARTEAVLREALRGSSELGGTSVEELDAQVMESLAVLEHRAANPLGDLVAVEELQLFSLRVNEAKQILTRVQTIGPVTALRVSGITAELPQDIREDLYASYRRHGAVRGAVGNLLPVIHRGSWRQGDRIHALVSGGVSLAGYALALLYASSIDTGEGELRQFGDQWAVLPAGTNPVGIGLSIIGGIYLYNVARPLWYTHAQNVRLARALGVETRGPQW